MCLCLSCYSLFSLNTPASRVCSGALRELNNIEPVNFCFSLSYCSPSLAVSQRCQCALTKHCCDRFHSKTADAVASVNLCHFNSTRLASSRLLLSRVSLRVDQVKCVTLFHSTCHTQTYLRIALNVWRQTSLRYFSLNLSPLPPLLVHATFLVNWLLNRPF